MVIIYQNLYMQRLLLYNIMLHADFVNDLPLAQPVLYLEMSILYSPLYLHGAKLRVGEVARLVTHALCGDGALWSPTSKK